MQINLMTSHDLAGLASITPKDWADVRPHYRHYMSATYCDALKVEEEGVLIGVGAIIRHRSTAWLAHILVSEDHRGKGVGKFLTQALIDRIDRTVYPTILLIATNLGEYVYRRLGFEVEMEYAVFKWGEGRFLQPHHALTPYAQEWDVQLFALDQWVSGEYRADTLRDHLSQTKLITENKTLLAAYFPTLGDGLVIARDADVGRLLLRVRMGEKTMALMPSNNEQAVKVMTKQGLEPYAFVKRMFLGKPHIWNPQGLYNRIGGHLG